MHREKCAWGQTGQKNVMALLVPMAEPRTRVETLVDARLTSNPRIRDATTTSSRLRQSFNRKNPLVYFVSLLDG